MRLTKGSIFRILFILILQLPTLFSVSCAAGDLQPASPQEESAPSAAPELHVQTETLEEQPVIIETTTPTPPTEEEKNGLRVFDQFIEDVKTGEAERIVGLWVENVMALRVVYQPPDNPGYVSNLDKVATYFMYPWEKAGNHGLLAHNYLAGRFFFQIEEGDIITLVFGDGYYMDFEVTRIRELQALQPDSPYSDFIDLETGQQMSVNTVFIDIYMGEFHTVLQTCIANGAETEWGRHFTIAPPLD